MSVRSAQTGVLRLFRIQIRLSYSRKILRRHFKVTYLENGVEIKRMVKETPVAIFAILFDLKADGTQQRSESLCSFNGSINVLLAQKIVKS